MPGTATFTSRAAPARAVLLTGTFSSWVIGYCSQQKGLCNRKPGKRVKSESLE
jgi:hypothetical protein